MGERSVAWRPGWQEILQAAQDHLVMWRGCGGLGGGYTLRGQYLIGPAAEPVEKLIALGALLHTRPGPPRLTGVLLVTPRGHRLLEDWRNRAA